MADIHTVTVMFKVPGMSIQFQFNGAAAASGAYGMLAHAKISGGAVEIVDHFGSVADVDTSQVMAVVSTDIARQHDGQRAMQILAAHAQVKTQNEAKNDPLLRVATGNGSIIGANSRQ